MTNHNGIEFQEKAFEKFHFANKKETSQNI
jgi:hypothetical protein